MPNGTTLSLRQQERADLFSKGRYFSSAKLFHAAERKFDDFAFACRSRLKTEVPRTPTRRRAEHRFRLFQRSQSRVNVLTSVVVNA